MSLVVTMFLGGLWHGAAWKFVIWGLYHGLLLVVFRFLPFWSPDRQGSGVLASTLKAVVIFHLVCFGWLIFRCQDLGQIIYYPWAMLHNFAWDHRALDTLRGLLCLGVPVLLMDLAAETGPYWAAALRPLQDRLGRLGTWGRYLAYTSVSGLLLVLMFLFGVRGGKEFIYFQF